MKSKIEKMKYMLNTLLVLIGLLAFSCGKNDDPVPGGDGGEDVIIANQGKVLCDNKGIEGVVVTDGTYFDVTDSEGSYSLDYNPSATHIYISSPSGYAVPFEESVPKFWIRLKDVSDKKNINFNLQKIAGGDTKHYFIAVGDPQVRNKAELDKLAPILNYMVQEIDDSAINPVHLMVAGDVVFNTPDMHDLSKQYFEKVNEPVYYTIGNHDHVFNRSETASDNNDKTADSVYVRHYGPTCYSFNRGEVHYLVLDNIFFQGGANVDYSLEFTSDQLKWAQKDLSFVPKSKALVVMFHGPSQYPSSTSLKGNSADLYALLSGYSNVQIICGHTHYNSVVTDYPGITEHIVGAACGGWWEGPVCPDGALLGYKIFEVNGTEIKWTYRSYLQPKDQFSVFLPEPRAPVLPDSDELLVNVWDWDPMWSVTYSLDRGTTYTPMTRYSDGAYDPTAIEYFGEEGNSSFPPGRTWINAEPTNHIFQCVPPNNAESVIIKVVNRFGKVFQKEYEL